MSGYVCYVGAIKRSYTYIPYSKRNRANVEWQCDRLATATGHQRCWLIQFKPPEDIVALL